MAGLGGLREGVGDAGVGSERLGLGVWAGLRLDVGGEKCHLVAPSATASHTQVSNATG